MGLEEAPTAFSDGSEEVGLKIEEERAARARARGKLVLFLSHRHKDYNAAAQIKIPSP